MGKQVVMGALLKCSFGAAPSTLVVPPTNKVLATTPAANIMDHMPMANIPSFGMCNSKGNPAVTPVTPIVPCTPVTVTPWSPGCPKVLIGNMPALESNSTCKCMWGGVITVVKPGQKTVQDG
ncbi:DUF4280 domain-containing protein [Archangium lansingense]|uniref:DUF4280 domain-containing protein n=1 Tax=Archangium lansingense TaxID=2995310 RepID=A0ABT4AAS1_9BACT|nr:DUF4280 domain-containing protein [Archangium lansinium]MCY1078671.1 DUF4280 domain-containing protein [Archangium lansinium]